MDFPISVPSIGLVDGKFADEDPLAGTPGSLIPAQWGNGVTLEILNVIEAAGLEPSEFNNAQLLLAVKNIIQGAESRVLTDVGGAGAYAAANPIPLTGQPATGFIQRVKIANQNPGAATYSPDGIPARPIYGLGLQPLQGGELPAGVAIFMYLVQAGVNGGNGVWVLIETLGGAQQVSPATKGQHAAQLQQVGHGQCRLSVVSSASLKLVPYGGNNLIIDGVPQQIPSAGITASSAGLGGGVGYYVYAYMNSGVMNLECSTTARATHTNGVEIKAGDPTRTLVGWTRTGAGGIFQVDAVSAIVTMNWFNRRQRSTVISASSDLTFTNTTISELSSLLRVYVPAWAGDTCISNINGNFLNSVSGSGVNIQLYSNDLANGTRLSSNLGADVYCPFNTQAAIMASSDGIVNCQLYAFVGSGTGRVVTGAQLLISSMV